MQIGIDARAALLYRGSGIGTYTHQLICGLLSIDPLNDYQLVYPPAQWTKVHDGFQLTGGAEKNRSFWQEVQEPPNLEAVDLDIYHNPQNGIGLPSCRPTTRLVVTIHDVIPFVLPQTCSKRYLQTALEQVPRSVDLADYIIAVSLNTKRDLVRILGVPEERIAVIHEAAEPIYKPMCRKAAETHVREKWGINTPYILNVGGFSRRKNLVGLLRAFHRIVTELPDGCQLVLTGGPGGGSYE